MQATPGEGRGGDRGQSAADAVPAGAHGTSRVASWRPLSSTTSSPTARARCGPCPRARLCEAAPRGAPRAGGCTGVPVCCCALVPASALLRPLRRPGGPARPRSSSGALRCSGRSARRPGPAGAARSPADDPGSGSAAAALRLPLGQTARALPRADAGWLAVPRKKGRILGGMLTRWYHLVWDDKEEKGILHSFNNDKMQGPPRKMISLKQCVPAPPRPAPLAHLSAARAF